MKRPGAEFWELTYREIFACIEQYHAEQDELRCFYGTGPAVALTIASQGKRNFTSVDIFPPRTQATWKPKSIEEIRDQWRTAHSIVGSNR